MKKTGFYAGLAVLFSLGSAVSAYADTGITFQDMALVDNASCRMELLSLDKDAFYGYEIKLQLENRTEDQRLVFAIEEAAVNGLETYALGSGSVDAGSQSEETISLLELDEYLASAQECTRLDITYRIYNPDKWMEEDIAGGTVTVYPFGEERETVYERPVSSEDEVLLDNEAVTVTAVGTNPESFFGYELTLFIENKTSGQELSLVAENVLINGQEIATYWGDNVSAGRCAYSTVSWYGADLTEAGVDRADVQEIQMDLKVSDAEDWTAENIAEETVLYLSRSATSD